MKIKFGSNRLVIVCKKFVYKIAYGYRGYVANIQEHINAKQNSKIAKTSIHWYGLKQERLTDIKIYPLDTPASQIAPEHYPLKSLNLHNRLQVGKDKNGVWKIFDGEDIKYYLKDLKGK